MAAYNVVRMRVKPGREEQFLELQKTQDEVRMRRLKDNGLRRIVVIKFADRSYCLIGEWDSKDAIQKSVPDMIAGLDLTRDLLEDLGGGLGVTDPISGEVVAELA
jgi:hypothetical protein